MAAGNTYVAIASQTVSSAASSVTFSSIPATYTDLVMVVGGIYSTAATMYLKPNSDSSDIYSFTQLYGTGSATGTSRGASPGGSVLGLLVGYPSTSQCISIISINQYANTSIYKTSLARFSGAGNYVVVAVGLWRSTAAINSLTLTPTAGTISTGTVLSLYGILAA